MKKKKQYILKNTKGEVIAHDIKMAENMTSRILGLMFSKDLPNCDGLLISPCNSIHTFFMNYSIDVLFLSKDFKCVKVIYDLAPWKMTWMYFRASHVLEMKAGTMPKGIIKDEKFEALCIN